MYHRTNANALRQEITKSVVKYEHSCEPRREAILKYLADIKARLDKFETTAEVYISMYVADLLGIGEQVRVFKQDTLVEDVDEDIVIA